MIKRLFVIFILLSLVIIPGSNSSYVIANEYEEYFVPQFADYATSPTEYFNETKHPRYDLVARPLAAILNPHKGNPIIIEYDENFTITVSYSFNLQNVNFSLINDENTIDLEIIDSSVEMEIGFFVVEPTQNIEGLYDLELNSTLSYDYQTHCVKIVNKKEYPFKFVHISDCHFPSYSGTNTTDINLLNIAELKNSDADFAIFTGDLIEGGSAWEFVNPVDDKPLAAEIQLRLGLWALDLLDMPVYIIGGNHDLDSTAILPDDPEEIWKKYLGHPTYPVIDFEFLDWIFVGFSATDEGISTDDFNLVKEALKGSKCTEEPNVLFYHSDYKNQPSNLRSGHRIEVMLYGHEHHEELFVQDHTLYHCEDAMFYNGSSIFTVLNRTSISLDDIIYDFTILLQPIEESSYSNYFFFGIIPLFVISILLRKKKNVKV
ncbi:MAG: metallophosphoesterase [Candidatus Heimdallarchaeota archaeon]|nr:metallophosphoesterase [Candidatus Heimdallarchaeota archaeon]MCK4877176.1 metallophosphoesterase [Candidatus Heimdallarchaeota archaeon]